MASPCPQKRRGGNCYWVIGDRRLSSRVIRHWQLLSTFNLFSVSTRMHFPFLFFLIYALKIQPNWMHGCVYDLNLTCFCIFGMWWLGFMEIAATATVLRHKAKIIGNKYEQTISHAAVDFYNDIKDKILTSSMKWHSVEFQRSTYNAKPRDCTIQPFSRAGKNLSIEHVYLVLGRGFRRK